MMVVTFGLVLVQLWLNALFALVVNSATVCRHLLKNQTVENLRVLGNLETEHAGPHMTVQNLSRRVQENRPPFWQRGGLHRWFHRDGA